MLNWKADVFLGSCESREDSAPGHKIIISSKYCVSVGFDFCKKETLSQVDGHEFTETWPLSPKMLVVALAAEPRAK